MRTMSKPSMMIQVEIKTDHMMALGYCLMAAPRLMAFSLEAARVASSAMWVVTGARCAMSTAAMLSLRCGSPGTVMEA